MFLQKNNGCTVMLSFEINTISTINTMTTKNPIVGSENLYETKAVDNYD